MHTTKAIRYMLIMLFFATFNLILVSDGGRGRYPSGRGGFRNEGFRGRGRFGGGRGYGRNEFRNQGEFSGRPRSSHRSSQNGGGRGGRHGAGNHNVTQSTTE